MSDMYLVRTLKGRLTLHQRQPRRFSRNKVYTHNDSKFGPQWKMVRKYDKNPVFIHGQVFRLNEFPGSERVLASSDNLSMMKAELYIPKYGHTLHQQLWVTRGADYRLMLHYNLKPTRMRESDDFNRWTNRVKTTRKLMGYTNDGRAMHTVTKVTLRERCIKKSANKWTSWAGHCYISEFPGSENIRFDDEEPTRVEVKVSQY